MLDILKIKAIQPLHAEGHVCIELKDPITGKVTYRETGKNYVFPDGLLCGPSRNWVTNLSSAYLELTDSDEDIDTTFPYMIGTTIGYGIPSTGSSGLLRGAYSVANQVLASANGLSSLRWKFQYDFTTGQANGTIRRIGLTTQYLANKSSQACNSFPYPAQTNAYSRTCNGRNSLTISSAGIVTIFDNYLGTSTTIDLSATVDATNAKMVGYAPNTGKYYIYKYSTTATTRRMYVYSDITFTTLETTYTPTNVAFPSTTIPMYIYGDYAFTPTGTGIYYADFVNNTAYVLYTLPTHAIIGTAPNYGQYSSVGYGKYIINSGASNASNGYIFDMAAKIGIGGIAYPFYANSACIGFRDAIADAFIINAIAISNTSAYTNPGIAMKKLDTPVTKTSANGMTVTYELEVYW